MLLDVINISTFQHLSNLNINMSRPVQYNNKLKTVEGIPEGYDGRRFYGYLIWKKWLALPVKILSGLYHLQHPVVVLNLWQPWPVIMILQGLVQSV